MLKAIIFDMDGVIIDSEPLHAKAAILALKKYNIDISPDYLQQFIGSTTLHMCETMIREFHIDVAAEELLEENNKQKAHLLKEEGYPVIPYVTDLIKNLHDHGMKLIIASSSLPHAIENVMNTLQITPYFQGYVSGSMVKYPKPAPDIFLLAAKRLGVTPDECLVIEDSSHGISASLAAGMSSIGFVNPNSGNQDLSKATMLVEGFEEVDYHFINQVYQYAHNEPVEILTTEHFIVRELKEDDLDALYDLYSKPGITEYIEGFSGNLLLEREKLIAYIANVYHFYGFGIWGVFDKVSHGLVGRCGIELKQIDGESIHEISYLLDPAYQGHGYGTEIVKGVINYCKEHLNISKIAAIIDKDNTSSMALAERVGMQRIGDTLRNNRFYYKYEITLASN